MARASRSRTCAEPSAGMDQTPPTLDDIQEAATALAGAVMRTPCVASQTLSAIAGCDLFLKFENLQFTASFKERGARNKLRMLPSATLRRGVCAMSAGNHAQGVAYHARLLGAPATIVMPRGTPLTKIARTRDHGARVIVEGAGLAEASTIATRITAEEGLTFIHPYDDPAVIAGQGTVALEMIEAIPDLDILVVPIGGGGLISGMAIAAKLLKPHIRIIGVQSKAYRSMVRVLAGMDEPVAGGPAIAEGIAVKEPGLLTREIVRALIDDIMLVEEASIERAIALLLSIEKTVVEGAGAAALAAVLEHPAPFRGRRVGIILSGGNIDLRVLSSIALRELVRTGQLLRFEVPISDQPGILSELAGAIGAEGANIVDVSHDRLSLALTPKSAVLDLVVEVQDRSHGDAVIARLGEAGFAVRERPL